MSSDSTPNDAAQTAAHRRANRDARAGKEARRVRGTNGQMLGEAQFTRRQTRTSREKKNMRCENLKFKF